MKLNQLLNNLSGLPESVQQFAKRAVLYTAMSMHNTEQQVFGSNSTNMTQTIGSGGALASMNKGVVNEQTKKMTQTVRAIMNRMDQMDRSSLPTDYYAAINSGNIDSVLGKSKFLTEGEFKNQQQEESRSKTDLSSDYPIELDWQIKKVLLNEAYTDDNDKVYAKNIEIVRSTGGMVKIEDHIIAAHVKTLPEWSSYPNLIEFYTSIADGMPMFKGLQSGGGLQAVIEGIDIVMFTKGTHQGEEIFIYSIKGFEKVVIHNGQLVFKFFGSQLIA